MASKICETEQVTSDFFEKQVKMASIYSYFHRKSVSIYFGGGRKIYKCKDNFSSSISHSKRPNTNPRIKN